jgi:hypothetical protein
MGDDVLIDGKLTKLDGDFTIEGNTASLRRVEGDSLETITGKLTVNNVPELASLAFPKLTELGAVDLNGLPNLRALEFTSQVTKCPVISIQNTKLQDLNGINVDSAKSIFIANNGGIGNITMDVTNVTDFLTLSFNNAGVNVSFPKLLQTKNATFRAVGSLDLRALSKVSPGSLGIYESTLDTVSCPNLTTIAQDLTINTNTKLNNITFTKLQKVGASLQIANNTQLDEIKGFPALEEVNAALDMSGNLTEYVVSALSLQSNANIITVLRLPSSSSSRVSSTCSQPPTSVTPASPTTATSRTSALPPSTSAKATSTRLVPLETARQRARATTPAPLSPRSSCRRTLVSLVWAPSCSSRMLKTLAFSHLRL